MFVHLYFSFQIEYRKHILKYFLFIIPTMELKLRHHNAIRMGGNNLVVVLPRVWVYSNDVHPGDHLSLSIEENGKLVIAKEVD
ncbi:MAG: AbrB/MazE/SpoVT family DNA-binding domain-containing protein [Thermoplasmatales archaeon]